MCSARRLATSAKATAGARRGLGCLAATMVVALLVVAPAGATPPSPPVAQLDTARATGDSYPFPVLYAAYNLDIDAHGGASGENPGGTVSFDILINRITHPEPFPIHFAGVVTCLNVQRNTAVLNAETTDPGGPVTIELVDNGGGGADSFRLGFGSVPGCASFPDGFSFPDGTPFYPFSNVALGSGRATVFDAPPLPTSTAQCTNGGWRNYPAFKNQGDCVSFVRTGK